MQVTVSTCVIAAPLPPVVTAGQVASPRLVRGITIIYFIYQTACHACSPPPPVSGALLTPPHANETLARHVAVQRRASSKCVAADASHLRRLIRAEWINKT